MAKSLDQNEEDALRTLAQALCELVEHQLINREEARAILREYGVLPQEAQK